MMSINASDAPAMYPLAFAANATRQSGNRTWITCGGKSTQTKNCAALLGHPRGGCYTGVFKTDYPKSLGVCTCNIFNGLARTDLRGDAAASYGADACKSTNWVFMFSVILSVIVTLFTLAIAGLAVLICVKVVKNGKFSANITTSTLVWCVMAALMNFAW